MSLNTKIYTPPDSTTYNVAGVITINTDLIIVDCQQYSALSIQCSSMGSTGVVTPAWSNDGTNYVAATILTPAGATATTFNAAGLWTTPVLGRYFRLRLTTATTAGTTTLAVAELRLPVGPVAGQPVTMTSTTLSGTTNAVSGVAAHDAVISGNPHRIAGRALTSSYTAVASGDTADFISTTDGRQVIKQGAISENDWFYAAASGGITNTTDVAAKAAAAAGIRNYITGVQLRNSSATATEFVIKDGATVIWRTHLPASMAGSQDVQFCQPLRGTAATAVNIACITTGTATYANLQGYIAP